MSEWNTNNDGWGAPSTNNQTGSVWDSFETIEPKRAKNDYLPAGVDGVFKIIEMKVIQSVKNNNRPMFIASIELIDGVGGESGQRWDWVAKADERAYLQNIKSLVCALNPQADPRTFGRELMDKLCGPEQPAAGLTVRCRTEAIQTQKGHDFTKVHWSPAN